MPGQYEDDNDDDRFQFWSGAELGRLGLIAGLLALPLTAVAVDRGPHHDAGLATSSGAEPAPSNGRLLAVRVTPLDMSKLKPSSLADSEQ
jgi:hypothetical protein